MNWVFVGSLASGQMVYVARSGEDIELAIEKDHAHLVDPTSEELAEIRETMSHVRALMREGSQEGAA